VALCATAQIPTLPESQQFTSFAKAIPDITAMLLKANEPFIGTGIVAIVHCVETNHYYGYDLSLAFDS